MSRAFAQLLRRLRRFALAGAAASALLAACWATPAWIGHNGIPGVRRHEGRRHEIDLLEDQWRNAVLNGNTASLDSLLANDYMAITANGTLQTRDETLANLHSWHIRSLTLQDRKVRFYGRTALVTSRAELQGTAPDGNISGNYRYTRVYVRDPQGNWKIVSFEASRIHNAEQSSAR